MRVILQILSIALIIVGNALVLIAFEKNGLVNVPGKKVTRIFLFFAGLVALASGIALLYLNYGIMCHHR